MTRLPTVQYEHPPFRRGDTARLFLALILMAACLLWIEHRAPLASTLICGLCAGGAAFSRLVTLAREQARTGEAATSEVLS